MIPDRPNKPELHISMAKFPSIYLSHSFHLTQLELSFSFLWGFYPRVQLSQLHFPEIKAFTLRRLTTINTDYVDWIVAHSLTLQELILIDCAVIIEVTTVQAVDTKGYPNHSLSGNGSTLQMVWSLLVRYLCDI
jgi:hypothetical protein